MKFRRPAPCLALVAGLICFGAGRATAQDFKGEIPGKWQSFQAAFKFGTVNKDGTVVGSCKLLEGRWKGWLITFTGKLDKDGSLTLNRTDKVDAKGAPDANGTVVKQMSKAGAPKLVDNVYVWNGLTTTDNVPDAVFELRVGNKAAPAGIFQVEFSNKTDVTVQLYYLDGANHEVTDGEIKPGDSKELKQTGLQNVVFRFKVNKQKLVDYTVSAEATQRISLEKAGFTGESFTPNVFARSSFLRPWTREQKQLLGLN